MWMWVYWTNVGLGVLGLTVAAVGIGPGRLRRLPGVARLLMTFLGLQSVGTGGRDLHWPVAVNMALACASLVTAVVAGWVTVRRRLRERRSPTTLPYSGQCDRNQSTHQ